MLNNRETMTACANRVFPHTLQVIVCADTKNGSARAARAWENWGLLTFPTVSPAIVAERFEAFLNFFFERKRCYCR